MPKVVLVASLNPVKTEAIRDGFQKVFPDHHFDIIPVNTPSGVSDQPIGMNETLKGAVNRVEYLFRTQGKANFYAGIEGGVTIQDDEMYAFAWVVVRDQKGVISKAQTGHFQLPPRVRKLVEQGVELGHAMDRVFGLHNSKQESGAVGVLTDQVIDRKHYYVHAVILALIPFLKPELFSGK